MVAALSAWHEHHMAAARALVEVRALPAHVVIETYAVLTRLPSGLAVPAAAAAGALAHRFDQPSLRLGDAERASALASLAAAGVFGRASYDGLVALEAKAHDQTLLTLDQRALATYQRLGTAFTTIS